MLAGPDSFRGGRRGALTLNPWSAYWRGTHEPSLQQALIGVGGVRSWNCWDLGAPFGIYSVGLARRVGPDGAVAAFEPNPGSYARLVRHQRMNRLSNPTTFQAGRIGSRRFD